MVQKRQNKKIPSILFTRKKKKPTSPYLFFFFLIKNLHFFFRFGIFFLTGFISSFVFTCDNPYRFCESVIIALCISEFFSTVKSSTAPVNAFCGSSAWIFI